MLGARISPLTKSLYEEYIKNGLIKPVRNPEWRPTKNLGKIIGDKTSIEILIEMRRGKIINWYLDSSAILKFVIAEPERPVDVKVNSAGVISSELSRFEARRAVFRMQQSTIELANEGFGKINFADLSGTVLRKAGLFGKYKTLESCDAIHFATIQLLGERVKRLKAYDNQMAKNAGKMEFDVFSPGSKV